MFLSFLVPGLKEQFLFTSLSINRKMVTEASQSNMLGFLDSQFRLAGKLEVVQDCCMKYIYIDLVCFLFLLQSSSRVSKELSPKQRFCQAQVKPKLFFMMQPSKTPKDSSDGTFSQMSEGDQSKLAVKSTNLSLLILEAVVCRSETTYLWSLQFMFLLLTE